MTNPPLGAPGTARPVKTSFTHPLTIATVGTPGGGRIGMTLCPGKRQPHAVTGPWERDLDVDMDAIKAFGATALVTLMENDELERAAVPHATLNVAASARGIDWLHLPVTDFQAPNDHFEHAWHDHGPRLRARLLDGQTIVIHCRGGRGRSGMIAARLLVEMGIAPEAAIIMVRAANSLAIETAAQENHVRDCRRQTP